MSYSIPSLIVLVGIVLLLLYIVGKAKVRREERVSEELSKYTTARFELSKGRFGQAAEMMYGFLKGKDEQIRGSARGRTREMLEMLAKFSKGKGKVDFTTLAREYTSTLEHID